MEQEACPQEVIDRAAVLYHNGFSGFQGPPGGGKDRFVLCWPSIGWASSAHFERDVVPQLREASGAQTLRLDDWIGRDYLSVHWSEYHRRFDVLSAMLLRGYAFQTQTKGMPAFGKREGDGPLFTQALLERRVMTQCRELIELNAGLIDMVDDACCEEWNWSSDEGRAFARMLRERKAARGRRAYDETRENFYNWPLFQAYDPATLRTIAPESPALEHPVEQQQRDLCMCCMDRPADTMVLPCEHAVVCSDCSRQLEATNNSWLCIKCRQPITHKLM
jgi:hypothetical protein